MDFSSIRRVVVDVTVKSPLIIISLNVNSITNKDSDLQNRQITATIRHVETQPVKFDLVNILMRHRIVRVTQIRKEGNVLFNDALNTFLFTVIWRQAYGKRPFR